MIATGDKVVCVDDAVYGLRPSHPGINHPGGRVAKGSVYVVNFLFVTGTGKLKLGLVGLPVIRMDTLKDIGWRAHRFVKLEQYRAQQELEFLRDQPLEAAK